MAFTDSSEDRPGSLLATCDLQVPTRERNGRGRTSALPVPSDKALPETDRKSLPGPVTAEQALEEAAMTALAVGFDLKSTKPGLLVRFFEVIVSATALLLLLPVMLVVGWIIRKGTPGPAVFFQTRVGKNFKPFTFCKYRTLFADAKERFPELYAYQYNESEVEALKFKQANDPRVTPQGAWLRKSSLDELPNFWNVLTGQMALVGPRPEIPEMLPYYNAEMLQKFTVRPGITGLAQVSGRGDLSFLETVQYDLEYVEQKNWWLDTKILFRTVYRILMRDGAF